MTPWTSVNAISAGQTDGTPVPLLLRRWAIFDAPCMPIVFLQLPAILTRLQAGQFHKNIGSGDGIHYFHQKKLSLMTVHDLLFLVWIKSRIRFTGGDRRLPPTGTSAAREKKPQRIL